MATVHGVRCSRTRLRIAALTMAGVIVASCGGPTETDGRTPQTAPSMADTGTAVGRTAPETVTVTPAGESWFDPEVLVHDERGWMTWQDGVGRIWLAELDLADGLPGPEGPGLVAADAAPMLDTNNGPELGVDAHGISLWYTASTPEGLRAARVAVGGAGATVEAVTSTGYLSPIPSRRPGHPTTLVVALRRPPGFGTAVWFDEATPSETTDLVWLPERGGGDARWVVGTGLLTVAGELDRGAAVELVDTDTGSTTQLGAVGDGVAENPYGWVDPDTGRVSVLAVVDGDELVVWDLDGAGSPTERLRVSSPDDAHPYLGSPEPFLVDGRAWATLTVADRPTTVPGRTDQQVWVAPLDGGTPIRCDDGAAGSTTRVDPEVIVSDDQVFVYYYAMHGASSQVHRCAVPIMALEG